jgi:hypothetical protein
MAPSSAASQAARTLLTPAVAHDRDHGRIGIRQHHADRATDTRERHELAAQNRGADQKPLVAQHSGDRILDRDVTRTMQARGLDHGFKHGAIGRGGAEHKVRHDLVERHASRLPPPAALERGIDGEPDRLEHRDRDLGEPFAAHLPLRQTAERCLLEPLDTHRHDLGIGLVGDHGSTVIDLHQAAGHGDAPFRKDDQRVAGLDRVDQRPHRHRLHRIERQSMGEFQKRLDPPMLGDAGVDREDGLAAAQRHRQAGVEEAHMVECDDDVGASLVQVLEPLQLVRRHGAADRDRHQKAADAKQQEHARCGQPDRLQQRNRNARASHEARIEHIDARHHAGTAVGACPGLHGGKDRDDEQATGDRKPR